MLNPLCAQIPAMEYFEGTKQGYSAPASILGGDYGIASLGNITDAITSVKTMYTSKGGC